MKKLLPVLFLVSTSALAFSPNMQRGAYFGGGTWKTPNGDTGSYRNRTVISKVKGGVVVKERLVIKKGNHKHVENMAFRLQNTSKGFFKVLIKGTEAGTGYCIKRTCHMDVMTKDGHSEETFHIARDGRIMRVGSDTSKKFKVVWSGQMRKKNPAPAPRR